jgi:hypothetical protein
MHKQKGNGTVVKSCGGALNLDFPVDIGGFAVLKKI